MGATSPHEGINAKLPRYLEEGRPPFADWYNGAYVLESLPCALWGFLASIGEGRPARKEG